MIYLHKREYKMDREERIPNIFWKYYDLYRRKQITIEQFSLFSGLAEKEIQQDLDLISY